MRGLRILVTIISLMAAWVTVCGQDMSKEPAATLTPSIRKIAQPLGYSPACIERFHRSNPQVSQIDSPVSFKTEVKNMGVMPLRYEYSTVGGRIEGKGPNVTWHLAGVRPGTYTVEIRSDGSNRERPLYASTTVKISEFHWESEWFGFKAEITCPSDSVKAGEPATVSIKVEGAPHDAKIGYKWEVSAGLIKSGQGTPTILVDTTGLEGQAVKSTVELTGVDPSVQIRYDCKFVVSAPEPEARKVDEFPVRLRREEILARIDNYVNEVETDPTAQGYVISPSRECETTKFDEGEWPRLQVLERVIGKYMFKTRKLDPKRITFAQTCADPNGVFQLYIVPAGAKTPSLK